MPMNGIHRFFLGGARLSALPMRPRRRLCRGAYGGFFLRGYRLCRYARAAAYAGGHTAAFFRRTGYMMAPAIVAVINAAIEPAIIDLMPSLAISERRDGAMPPMPPIWMAIDPKLANPHKAYVEITIER